MRYISTYLSFVGVLLSTTAYAADRPSWQADNIKNTESLTPFRHHVRSLHHDNKEQDSSEQIIVTGTRDPSQTARKSSSPITVINGDKLRSTGMTDIREALVQLSPSISREVNGSDQGSIVDSLSLRGLNADQTLVLVNGKRRHTTAALNFDGGSQQGTTPVDLDMLPISSIDHIEILQDGAAAQYGSDAIAGVINIILKSNNKGVNLQSTNGGYYAGDGFTTGENINAGFNLGNRGFFNLSAEYKHQDRTQRTGIDPRTGRDNDLATGQPQVTREAIEGNFSYHITNKIEVYAFGTFTHRDAERWAYLRAPSTTAADGLSAVYPTGFEPVETLPENDYGVTAGVKGKRFASFDWDISSTIGSDHDNLSDYNSANATEYAETGYTKKRFYLGTYSNQQWTNNLDVRRPVDIAPLYKPLNIAFGAEYRHETYAMHTGEPWSYIGSGAQGYQGITPTSRVDAARHVAAAYVDFSTQFLRGWQFDLAGRFEHYSDVGNAHTGKISTRYDVNRYIGFRGTASTGFRAPTLAEENFANLTVSPNYANGQISPNSAAARYLGSTGLHPETSTNFSVGMILNPLPRLHVNVDAYTIKIKHRVVDGGVYNGQMAINAYKFNGIDVSGFGADPNSVSAQFFTNGANTRTTGLDITASYDTDFGRIGHFTWDAAVNFNHTNVSDIQKDGNGNPVLNAQQINYISTENPANKLIFGGTWRKGKWNVSVHEIRYGHSTSNLTYVSGPNAWSNSVFYEQVNKPRFVTNLEIGYQVLPQLHLALGGNNIGNTYPSRVPVNTSDYNNNKYDTGSQQLSEEGGFYYIRADFRI
ncbi:TonB-dependent receptor plug domain-containing protein [Komagataeibacter sucrofermentans]|uniref:TonB-dependent receptor n=1 Tax=Komagataeibacter sucrofermentans TaxID=1053551 RepID=A0A318QGH8_9PROT|nr:TonB-dependent receptor [Komagataeibacter sucrofermentans]PYD77680.1 TonB-dependent receptor [Komagataeibacter sucrofermentans]